MRQILFTDTKTDQFNGFDIVANECLFIKIDETQKQRWVEWEITKNGNFFLRDSKAIDGSNLNNAAHAINDAKKNINTLIRLNLI